MRAYTAFVKKEFREMARTYKLLIMGVVFFIIGVLSPVTAKFLPDLIKSLVQDGIQITITEPVAMDSWMQFYKNVPQMGLVVFVIVFSGIISNEVSKGTLVNVLTKGLSRKNVILAKFTSVGLIWTFSYFFCFVISYLYTRFFWEETVPSLFFSAVCLWFFGLMLAAIVILGGVLFKSSYGALLVTAIVIGALFMLNIIPQLQEYNPIMLSSDNVSLLRKERDVTDFILPLIVNGVLMVAALTTSVVVFNKKKL